jgi:hypothetical protein
MRTLALLGAAYVFARSAGLWSQQAYLKPAAIGFTQVNEEFGLSVAVSGDTVVIGAHAERSDTTGVNSEPNDNAGDAGAAYVFARSAGVWAQESYLKPAAVGTTQAGDQFGWAVAISGSTVIIGASQEDSNTSGVNGTPDENAANSGTAYLFTLTPDALTAWAAAYGVPNDLNVPGANGAPNLLNFAFGQNPNVSILNDLSYTGNVITTGGLRAGIIGTVPMAQFVRRKDHATAGLAYLVEFSADLGTWEPAATAPTLLADDGTHQVMGLPFPLMSGGAQATFFRLVVTSSP